MYPLKESKNSTFKFEISPKSSESGAHLKEIHESIRGRLSRSCCPALGYLLSEGVFSLTPQTVREEVGKKGGGDAKRNEEDRETKAPEVR